MILFKKAYEIFADYHQFYLMDGELKPYAPEVYTEDDVRRRIKIAEHIVVIQSERNMTVPVELEVHDSCPGISSVEWQNIAEASLNLPSGRLLIEECAGKAPIDEIALVEGVYRVRACFAGLDTLSWNGLEGDDRYKVIIWRAPYKDLEVLKQYRAGRTPIG